MRWRIRNQILLPLITIQLIVVATVSVTAAWWSLEKIERQVHGHLDDLADTIKEASFPLTRRVLLQMKGLSGADFAILTQDGTIRTSTLSETADVETRLVDLLQSDGLAASGVREMTLSGEQFLVRMTPSQQWNPTEIAVILYPTSLVDSARAGAVLAPALMGLATLLLTTLAVIAVSHRIGRRIQDIETQVARVAAGDFTPIRLPTQYDELRDLSSSVNSMAEDLDRLTTQIRENERTQLIKQLAGGIAHQLRNALTGARMAIQVHRRRCRADDDESLAVALRQLALTEEQVRGLVALIRDHQQTPQPGDFGAIIDETVALIRPLCEHRHLHLDFVPCGCPAPVADAEFIRGAILNLCMNGIEAAPEGGTLAIRCRVSDSMGSVEVSDNGPGIPPELEEQVFAPFFTTKPDGMGLGLALARQAAEQHSGILTYRRIDATTVFQFQIPIEAAAASPIAETDLPAGSPDPRIVERIAKESP